MYLTTAPFSFIFFLFLSLFFPPRLHFLLSSSLIHDSSDYKAALLLFLSFSLFMQPFLTLFLHSDSYLHLSKAISFAERTFSRQSWGEENKISRLGRNEEQAAMERRLGDKRIRVGGSGLCRWCVSGSIVCEHICVEGCERSSPPLAASNWKLIGVIEASQLFSSSC